MKIITETFFIWPRGASENILELKSLKKMVKLRFEGMQEVSYSENMLKFFHYFLANLRSLKTSLSNFLQMPTPCILPSEKNSGIIWSPIL